MTTPDFFVLPELPYAYDALNPVILPEIMELHHKKHHQAYVTNLNAAHKKLNDAATNSNSRAASDAARAIQFNAGGHFNHCQFWTILTPQTTSSPQEIPLKLQEKIQTSFGSLDKMIELFNQETVAIQGSGWGWLAYDTSSRSLIITTSLNQDPLRPANLVAIIGIDVWEHAYYLQYKNARADYLKAIWSIINWKEASERFAKATA